MSSAVIISPAAAVEEVQNRRNKMVAAHSRFFARKIHKIKKMLKPLFSRRARTPVAAPTDPSPPPPTSEELENALNEALEARLAEELSASASATTSRNRASVQALVDGEATLVLVHPRGAFTPNRFTWTFLPSPDNDIDPSGDLRPLSRSQTPQRQTPPATPH